MSRRRPILAKVALAAAALGLLTLGLCCWAAPGLASGWISGCHGSGPSHCSSNRVDPCIAATAAAATNAAKVEFSGTDPAPSSAEAFEDSPTDMVAADPTLPSAPPAWASPVGAPSPAVFLLHSSFLL